MKIIVSKEKYLKKLYVLLALCFEEADCVEVVNDYNDWFGNEIIAGRTEVEICETLGSPFRVVHKLFKESGHYKSWFSILYKNIIFQMVFFIISWFLCQMFLLKTGKNLSINFLVGSLIINLIYFVMGMLWMSGKKDLKRRDYGLNPIFTRIFPMIVICVGMEIIYPLILMKLNNKSVYIGKAGLNFLILIITIVSLFYIYQIVAEFMYIDFRFVLTMVAFGIISMFFNLINEHAMLYEDVGRFVIAALSGMFLLAEMLMLCLIYSCCIRTGKNVE